MKTISVISQKGGVGKTTIAIHLAGLALGAGFAPCLLDLDQQATARAWSSWRNPQNPTLDPEKPILAPEVITTPHGQLDQTLARAEALGADFAFIDTPPNADAAAVKAAKAADLIIIPCQPSAFDLHAILTTADLVAISRKPAYVVLNGAHPQAQKAISDATKLLTEYDLQIAPVVITKRAIYQIASERGKLVSEIEPIGSAARELDSLWAFVTHFLEIPATNQEAAA